MIELLEKRSSELFSSAVSEGALEDGIFATRKTAYRRFFKGGKSRDVSFSGNNNTTTNQYQVVVADGASRTLTYDPNGNCASDGLRTFEWSAKDEMTAINQGSHRTEFTYDGLGRRVRIVEKESDVVVSDKRFVWVGTEIAEERDSTGANVIKRFFPQGVQIVSGPDAGNYFWTRDHLGSVREMTDNAGTMRARYDFSPYGTRTKVSGDLESDFGFTGHYFHAPSGLHLAMYRAYDAELGRWLSRDPIAEDGGINLYAYCYGDPINCVDPGGDHPVLIVVVIILWGSTQYANAPQPGQPQYTGLPYAETAANLLPPGRAPVVMVTQAVEKPGFWRGIMGLFGFGKSCAAKSELGILGKGSTADLAKGTTLPRNLREQLAIEQAAASPAAGTKLRIEMTDPRWPASQGWEKWQQIIKPGGEPINVHYLRNRVSGQIDDFKIVLPGAR